jgi:hypothetical protein
VQNLDVDVLCRLAHELLRRQPAVFADLVNGEMVQHLQRNEDENAMDAPPADAPPADATPADAPPDWCKCGFFRSMPTQAKNKCCCGRKMPCITTKTLFRQLVLDANILDLQMSYREDILVMNNPQNNENFRHAAYRQYVLW